MLTIILTLVLAYLIGSIPFGLIIGKVFHGVDIREHGSGNLGGTNSFRILGKKSGAVVMIADILKGTVATILPILLGVDINPLIPGAIASFGHMYPIFAGFRGGKAVATSAGVILGYAWPMFLLIFVVFMVTLKVTKYVSMASIVGSVCAIIYPVITKDIPLLLITLCLASFIIYRHKANIERIKNGTEPKVKWI